MSKLGKQLLGSIAAFILLAALSGCGGGGADGSSSGEGIVFPSKILSWNPPTTYSDSASLDPAKDLERYELYVNESGTFSETASPMAEVKAVDSGTGQPRTSFDLANLGPFLFPGVTYQVSIRAVAVSGLKSGYSAVAAFSF